jgi:hypothetical protein
VTRFFLPIYRKVCLGIFSLGLLTSAVQAQAVTVIGPVTPGDCVMFSSVTVLKDAGFGCPGSGGSLVLPNGTTATTQSPFSDNTTKVATDAFVQGAISLNSTHFSAAGTTGGSANAQTISTVSPPVFSLTGNPTVTFIAGFSNTGATTLNVLSTGVLNVLKKTPSGLVALVTGDLISGQQYLATYDGTQYELQTPSQVTSNQIPNSTITYAQIQNETANTVLGRNSGAGAPAEQTMPSCPTGALGWTTNVGFGCNGSTVNGQAITPSKVNLICYVDGTTFTTLASAVASCTSNSTIIVSTPQTISSNISVSGSGVWIKCENAAVLTYSANISITFSGTDDMMEGCLLAGPGTGVSTSPPIKFTGNVFTFRKNVVFSFGSTSLTGIINGVSTGGSIQNTNIQDNNINGNADFGIDLGGTGNITRIRILNNYISNGVYIIPGTGAVPEDIVVNNNIIDAGSSGFTNPVGTGVACIQILGGNSEIFDLTVNNNACHLEGSIISAGSECWGVGGINRMTAIGNTCDPRGFTYPIAFELNQTVNFTFAGNQAFSGGTGSHGIYAENPSFGTIANNVINGFGTATSDAGIDLLPNTTSLNMQSVTITGNAITFASGGAGQGIAIRCTMAITCSDFTVANNAITSDGTAGSTGIFFNRTGGTATSAAVTGNSIRGPVLGIGADASWNDVCTGSNTAGASGTQLIAATTTQVNIVTAATHCH